MGALLPIRICVPSKLRESSAEAVQRDGPGRLTGGGKVSAAGTQSVADQLTVAGSLSAGRHLRAWIAERDRAVGGETGPAAVGEALSPCSEPTAGASPRT